MIAGFEAAWAFFGGIFKIVIPDNMAPIVDQAHPLDPRLNRAFAEYAQDRGFLIDPARVRSPADKPRVERNVPFVRGSFFAGESFADLADAQRKAEAWCAGRAGQRIHRTTQCRPAELFALEEAPRLLPAPVFPYDLPVYASPKVHRDHHIEVAKALYSVPGHLIGKHVDVRADRQLVRVWHRGQLVKVHPRARAGGRVTDPADLPAEKTAYAMRDLGYLQRLADDAGPAIGAYAAALLDHPLPWTKMRQVYALLGLVRRWGAGRVELACARALEAEAISVPLIGRMLQRGTEDQHLPRTPPFPACPRPVRPRRLPLRRPRPARRRRSAMSPPAPVITPELRSLLRRVKLGQLMATLPERLALARARDLSHAEFLELVLSDEVTRRDATSAQRRARAAGLDPAMRLENFDNTATISYDRHVLDELFSLRFVEDGRNAMIMGPVGVGKTFLATALGHAAIRRRLSVHFERADQLLKRLKASRLDNSHDTEIRKLLRVDLLILDDFCLQPMDAADTADIYEIIVERHRAAATIITSNREPAEWLALMADALLAQSAIDRLQSAAYELVLDGESYRRRQKPAIAPSAG